MTFKPVILLILANSCFSQGDNLLLNPDFEEPYTDTDWKALSCTVSQYADDAYAGEYSYKVSNTLKSWSSISQSVDLQPNTFYSVSMMVRLLNQRDAVLGEQLQLRFIYSENGQTQYHRRGVLPNLRMEQGWQKISGDFYTSANMSDIKLNLRSTPNVEYLVDDASMSVIQVDQDWRQAAEARIEQLRKNDIVINLQVHRDLDETKLQLHVIQKTHDFPFGSMVRHHDFIGTEADNDKYREVFFSNFNWAVIGNKMKWKGMEWTQGVIKYPDESLDILKQRGIPVRGHNVFWGVEGYVPNWLKNMTKEEVLAQMSRRIEYVIPHYKQSVVHWDVNNEDEHGKWFETHTGDPYIMDWMFREVHERAETTKLFLNDFSILTGGTYLQTYVNTAVGMLDRGVPVHALGIQGHFGSPPNIAEVLYRLDKAAEAGLPIWITELDIIDLDMNERANSYDDLVTCFFGHPAVDGLILWGFVDIHHWRPDAALFEGSDYTPNAAGLRWQELMQLRWRTSQQFSVSEKKQSFEMRGFYGTYELQVIYDGTVIQTKEFHLQRGATATVDVKVSSIEKI